MHGLPSDYVQVVLTTVDMDPAFVSAHAALRRYRPLGWRKTARFATLTYPEMVVRLGRCSAEGGEAAESVARGRDSGTSKRGDDESGSSSIRPVDLMPGLPPARTMGRIEEDQGPEDTPAAVFCRGSLWMAAQADVLFLDKPSWHDARLPLRKARRPFLPATTALHGAHGDRDGFRSGHLGNDARGSSTRSNSAVAEAEEADCLEDVLFEMLKDAASLGEESVGLFSHIVHDHWLDFFQALEPLSRGVSHKTTMLYSDTMRLLEHNADGTRDSGIPAQDWAALQSRLQARIALLLSTMPLRLEPRRSLTPLASCRTAASRATMPRAKSARQVTFTASSSGRSPSTASIPSTTRTRCRLRRPANATRLTRAYPSHAAAAPSLVAAATAVTEKNQRALDRISYLGGILIPFPIVSSILSMGDSFGPGGPLFYVFWAWSIPLSAVAVLIIYADILRKAEVWVEISAATMTDTFAAVVDEDEAAARHEKGPLRRRRSWPSRSSRIDTVGRMEEGLGRKPHAMDPPCPDNGTEEPVPEAAAQDHRRIPTFPSTSPSPYSQSFHPLSRPGTVAGIISNRLGLLPLPASRRPILVLESTLDGSPPTKAWRRQQLGWSGAVQAIVGYRRPRRANDGYVPEGVPLIVEEQAEREEEEAAAKVHRHQEQQQAGPGRSGRGGPVHGFLEGDSTTGRSPHSPENHG